MQKSNHQYFPHLECITRISNIPIVETGFNYAGQVYTRIKNSNSLVYWTLGTAETSLNTALEVAIPSTVAVFGGPINTIDKIVCKSLDMVEQRVPNIYLPPQMMYFQTKQYVSSKFVRPMLKRADSVKQIGNQVLASKYTEFAADRLDEALNVADMYVDKYFPDAADQMIVGVSAKKMLILSVSKETGQIVRDAELTKAKTEDESAGKAVQTIHHVDRLSRKLQRRLTKRTLAEAKALKERSQESIHVLLYVAELIAKDPKLALEKARQLWDTLSENEPENQARPATLEQLIVLLTRESARRVVHFVNFTRYAVGKLPVTISKGVNLTTRQCRQILDLLIKRAHLEGLSNAATDGAKIRARRVSVILKELNTFTNVILERLALSVAGQTEVKKPIKHTNSNKVHHHHHRNNFYGAQSSTLVQTPMNLAVPVPPITTRSTHRVPQRYNNSVNNGAQT